MHPEVDFGMGHRSPDPQALRRPAPTAPTAEPIISPATVEEVPLEPTDPESEQLFDLLRRYFKIPQDAYEDEHDCRHAIAEAASLCLTYGFFPGHHVRARRIAGEWTCEVGYRGWLDSANAASKAGNFFFDIETVQMTDAQVSEHLRHEYRDGDVGYFARVLHSGRMEMYHAMGREYDPQWSFGFWQKLGYQDEYGEWHADPVWAGRDKEYTAIVRASKAALMNVFSLVELDHYDVDVRLRRLLVTLSAEMIERERDRIEEKLLVRPEPRREEDGDLLWA